MKKSRYREEQIVSILREAESGTVTAAAREHGVAEQSIYRWRQPNVPNGRRRLSIEIRVARRLLVAQPV